MIPPGKEERHKHSGVFGARHPSAKECLGLGAEYRGNVSGTQEPSPFVRRILCGHDTRRLTGVCLLLHQVGTKPPDQPLLPSPRKKTTPVE